MIPTLLTLALVAAAPAAMAATATDTMNVSITIENSCTIVANDLAFGTHSSLANNIDAQTTVQVTCTAADSDLRIKFDAGIGGGASFTNRKMTLADGSAIEYSLYDGSDRTLVLGDGSPGTYYISVTSTGETQTYDVFGRVFGAQGVKEVGNYTDTVTATVEF